MLFGLWCDAVDGRECGRGDCPKMGMRESRRGLKLEPLSPGGRADTAAPPEHSMTRRLQSVCVQTVSVSMSLAMWVLTLMYICKHFHSVALDCVS